MKINSTNQKNNKGFTLVELAIVIVIIGLLVGGVLQGQELITQAQIRSSISSIQGYNAALNTFRAKYNEMPGDISRAGTFGLNVPKGGSTINVCSTSGTALSTTAGADGNGNGNLDGNGATACSSTAGATTGGTTAVSSSAAVWTSEIANFWVHLANAQLVKGAYSQATVNGNVETAYPAMPVGTGIIALSSGGLTYWVTGVPGTIATMASLVSAGSLSPAEAFGIDGKLDDGAPGTGVTTAVNGSYAGSLVTTTTYSSSCASSATAYNMAGSAADQTLCLLAIRADG